MMQIEKMRKKQTFTCPLEDFKQFFVKISEEFACSLELVQKMSDCFPDRFNPSYYFDTIYQLNEIAKNGDFR